MGRAFTEEEKVKIKADIMETALDLFHDKGTKSLNIAELTRRVGIAQGSFYNFWSDKDSLIIDLIAYRSAQKLKGMEKEFSNSLTDPIGFLAEMVCRYYLGLVIKVRRKPIYEDAFKIFKAKKRDEVNGIERPYREFLTKLINYWQENSAVKNVDKKGLDNALIGCLLLCSEYYRFDEEYFEDILKTYVLGTAAKYIEL